MNSRIRNISLVLLGTVFTFSGLVKCIDPLGSSYKIEDYLIAFNMVWGLPLALAAAILQSAVETAIGLSLVTRVRLKESLWAALIFLAFYTPLTLYIAIANPVEDCGCFGDAIHLSNTATFAKNLVLCLILAIVFPLRKLKSDRGEWWSEMMFLFFGILFCLYTIKHLPVIDFRPYRTGNNIATLSHSNSSELNFKTIFKYEKDGIVKEFTEDDYPWNDTTWHWVDAYNVMLDDATGKAMFSVQSPDGEDITSRILEEETAYLVISFNLDKFDPKGLETVRRLYGECLENNHGFYFISGSEESAVEDFRIENTLPMEINFMDGVELKTIVRANPGIVRIQKGIITDKWNFRDY